MIASIHLVKSKKNEKPTFKIVRVTARVSKTDKPITLLEHIATEQIAEVMVSNLNNFLGSPLLKEEMLNSTKFEKESKGIVYVNINLTCDSEKLKALLLKKSNVANIKLEPYGKDKYAISYIQLIQNGQKQYIKNYDKTPRTVDDMKAYLSSVQLINQAETTITKGEKDGVISILMTTPITEQALSMLNSNNVNKSVVTNKGSKNVQPVKTVTKTTPKVTVGQAEIVHIIEKYKKLIEEAGYDKRFDKNVFKTVVKGQHAEYLIGDIVEIKNTFSGNEVGLYLVLSNRGVLYKINKNTLEPSEARNPREYWPLKYWAYGETKYRANDYNDKNAELIRICHVGDDVFVNQLRTILQRQKINANKPKKEKEAINEYGVEVGDIYELTFGYSMTLVNFYAVTKLIGSKTVELMQVSLPVISRQGTPASPEGSRTVYAKTGFTPYGGVEKKERHIVQLRNENGSHTKENTYIKIDNNYARPYDCGAVYECSWD